MKRRITIIDRTKELSDTEVQQFRDFDELLAKATQTKPFRWRIFLPILIGLVSVGAYLLYHLRQKESSPIKTRNGLTAPVDTLRELKATRDSVPRIIQKQVARAPKKVIPEVRLKEIESQDSIPQKLQSDYRKAEPINGYDSLYAYFNKELIYPKEILKDSIQGVLTVIFTINKEGKPQNFQFPNSLGKPFEHEAIRLLENMPPWRAAHVNGAPVSSKLSLPLTFRIEH